MNTTSVISAASTVVAAIVAGWFAFLARRASVHGPESVAGGYSRLVTDMRAQQEALMARVAGLELERTEHRRQLAMLMRQVAWLMEHVPEEHRVEFSTLFGEVDDDS